MKGLAAKHDDLSVNLITHTVEQEHNSYKLFSDLHMRGHALTPTTPTKRN